MTKLTAAQARILREIQAGRDPYGKSTATNRAYHRLHELGFIDWRTGELTPKALEALA